MSMPLLKLISLLLAFQRGVTLYWAQLQSLPLGIHTLQLVNLLMSLGFDRLVHFQYLLFNIQEYSLFQFEDAQSDDYFAQSFAQNNGILNLVLMSLINLLDICDMNPLHYPQRHFISQILVALCDSDDSFGRLQVRAFP